MVVRFSDKLRTPLLSWYKIAIKAWLSDSVINSELITLIDLSCIVSFVGAVDGVRLNGEFLFGADWSILPGLLYSYTSERITRDFNTIDNTFTGSYMAVLAYGHSFDAFADEGYGFQAGLAGILVKDQMCS